MGLSWHHHQYFIVGDSWKITFCVVGNPSFSFHLSRNENLMVSRSECWRRAKLPDPKPTPELASLQTVLSLPILRFLISSFMTVSSCSHFPRSLYRLFFVSETFDPFSQTSPLSLHDLRRLFFVMNRKVILQCRACSLHFQLSSHFHLSSLLSLFISLFSVLSSLFSLLSSLFSLLSSLFSLFSLLSSLFSLLSSAFLGSGATFGVDLVGNSPFLCNDDNES